MTTYTVFRAEDSSIVEGRGLTLAEAVDVLLTYDGYAYEIREADGLYELYVSDGSAASTRGARHMRSCAPGGYIDYDLDKLRLKIISEDWRGMSALSDRNFDDMMAKAEEE